MSAIPLYLQRKCEQRWAARFVSPAASAAPKRADLRGAVSNLPRPGKTKEKPAESRRGAWSSSTAWTSQVVSGQKNDPSTGARAEAIIHRM